MQATLQLDVTDIRNVFDKGQTVDCEVEVYPLVVDALLPKWPERTQRRREWFTLAQAALVIDDGELVPLLLRLAAPE